jgi:hypothetical protein
MSDSKNEQALKLREAVVAKGGNAELDLWQIAEALGYTLADDPGGGYSTFDTADADEAEVRLAFAGLTAEPEIAEPGLTAVSPIRLSVVREASDYIPSFPPREVDAGWYANPDAPGQRYYDGDAWTDNYAPPSTPAPSALPTVKDLLFALALGFGAMGAAGAIAIPLIAFYFPLGAGIASAALIVAAIGSQGETRWWAAFAVIACLLALGTGISAYNDFQDTSDAASEAIESLSGP